MKEIVRKFELDAGHRLANHDFKCQNIHGHRYKFKVSVRGEVDEETGMLVDFSNLKKPVMKAFDHNLILNFEDRLVEDDVVSIIEGQQEKQVYVMDCEPSVENIIDETAVIIVRSLSDDERERVHELEIECFETPNSKALDQYQVD